jgi:23S rRNA (cytidine1920-2'-O)/16S rRNA (cytidine1409-2'-O)-methyltransferase
MKIKKRLDHLVHEQLPHHSKRQIQSWIMQGKVSVDGRVITKPGTAVVPGTPIVLMVEEPKYVSRAGFKLEKALEHFKIPVQDRVALDAGLSTGGFTDCLLQHGVRKVYGVDVGYGQVHEKIKADLRVIVLERTNLRELTAVGEQVDLITLDLSFISVLKVMHAVNHLLKSDGALMVLIKPQFEAERHEVGKGGIIKNAALHRAIVAKVVQGIELAGFESQGIIESPITGADGNKEFLAYFKRSPVKQ